MNAAAIDLVIQYALLVAGCEDDVFDRELGPIHLIKYVYLADLAHAERNDGQTFSGVRWQFFHYGPWTQEVYVRIQPALRAIDAEEKIITSERLDNDFTRWMKRDEDCLRRTEQQLPAVIVSTVRRAVHQFGKDTPALLHAVYATDPMLRAAPGDILVFDGAARESKPTQESPTLSKNAEKKRDARVKALRARLDEMMAAKTAAKTAQLSAPPPRYDETFFDGLAWLDRIAGERLDASGGDVTIDPDVWSSETRGERRG